ncbi:aspartyl protease family protein [Treponema primitia]|uniref:aspartyl protease family protein n=1 Tax=Treponema primitia TaxID=88058 RepID=UPI0039811E21
MGTVSAEITLKNAADVANVQRGYIREEEVRQITVRALVDTGAGTLVINEEIRQKLGLSIRGLRSASLANDVEEVCKVTEPVEIHWNDRETACPSLVVSGQGCVLLGAIPLEDMDLIVNPKGQELVGAHGNEVITLLCGIGA